MAKDDGALANDSSGPTMTVGPTTLRVAVPLWLVATSVVASALGFVAGGWNMSKRVGGLEELNRRALSETECVRDGIEELWETAIRQSLLSVSREELMRSKQAWRIACKDQQKVSTLQVEPNGSIARSAGAPAIRLSSLPPDVQDRVFLVEKWKQVDASAASRLRDIAKLVAAHPDDVEKIEARLSAEYAGMEAPWAFVVMPPDARM